MIVCLFVISPTVYTPLTPAGGGEAALLEVNGQAFGFSDFFGYLFKYILTKICCAFLHGNGELYQRTDGWNPSVAAV